MRESLFCQDIQNEIRRGYILQVLCTRFEEEKVNECRQVLDAITDPQRLDELHLVANKCRRVSDFRRALGAASPS